jgi:hypothetical protein
MLTRSNLAGGARITTLFQPLTKSSGCPTFAGCAKGEDYLHRRRLPVTMRFHHNLYILIERRQEAQQAFHGELAKLSSQHLRYIRLADSEQISGFHLCEGAFL